MKNTLLITVLVSSVLSSYLLGIFNNITLSKFFLKQTLKIIDTPVMILISLTNIFSMITLSYMLFERGRAIVIGLAVICLFIISYEIFDAANSYFYGNGFITQLVDGKSATKKFYPEFNIEYLAFVFCSMILNFFLFGTTVNKYACNNLDIEQDFFYEKIIAVFLNTFLLVILALILYELGNSTFKYMRGNPLDIRGLVPSVIIQISLLAIFTKSITKLYTNTTIVIFLNMLLTTVLTLVFLYTSYSLYSVAACVISPICINSDAFLLLIFYTPWLILEYLFAVILYIPIWIFTTNYLICHFIGTPFGIMRLLYVKFPNIEKYFQV